MIAISGKPGGGKSFYACTLILDELLEGSRTIVTNIPLNLHKIQAWCVKKGRSDVDVYSRILIIEWQKMAEFWRYRSVTYTYEGQVDANEGGYEAVFKSFPPTPCFYVVDEAHEYFNSQEYKSLSRFTLAYVAKHRHLQDEVIWISQALGSVALDFRRRVQEFRYCRNWSKERFGMFSKGKGFSVYSYLYQFDEQKGESNSNPLQWTKRYTLDDRAPLYNTSLYNRTAEPLKKRPHFAILIVAILSVGALLVYGLLKIPSMIWQKALPPQTSITSELARDTSLENAVMPPSDQSSMTSLTIPTRIDPTAPLQALFPNSQPHYDSHTKTAYISVPTDQVQAAIPVISQLANRIQYIEADFSGFTALADSPYSWANEIPGTATVIADGIKYSLGAKTDHGTVTYVERNAVHLDNGHQVRIIPRISSPLRSSAPLGTGTDNTSPLDTFHKSPEKPTEKPLQE
jgi:hypothetical protein